MLEAVPFTKVEKHQCNTILPHITRTVRDGQAKETRQVSAPSMVEACHQAFLALEVNTMVALQVVTQEVLEVHLG